MGAHRLGCPNPEWMGLVDEQMFARDARDWRDTRDGLEG